MPTSSKISTVILANLLEIKFFLGASARGSITIYMLRTRATADSIVASLPNLSSAKMNLSFVLVYLNRVIISVRNDTRAMAT